MECQYCKTKVSDKYILSRHIKNNKKCLKLRGYVSLTKSEEIDKLKQEYVDKNIQFEIKIEQQQDYIKSKDTLIAQLIQQLEQKDKTIAKISKKQSRPQFEDLYNRQSY
jgi:hypothetical protein